jgi:Zn-dependent protease with chaperone function
MLALWPILIRLFQHGGVGGVLLSLNARDPNLGDLEERQLVNVVEEMAIASGLPPPRVMLIDANVANAAAVGSSPEDATIVVARPLLDDLGRDETQGVLAHLIASIGNGDLRAGLSIVAIFQTFGFAAALVKAPISGPARTTVRRMLGYVFSRHKPHERAAEAHVISEMLTSGIWENQEDDFQQLDEPAGAPVERPGPKLVWLLYFPIFFIAVFMATLLLEFPDALRRLSLLGVVALAILIVWYQRRYVAYAVPRALKMARMMIMLPYYMGASLPQIMISMLTSFMLEPMLAMLWRSRRYLADADAVQLTRQPDWIAKGLTGLIGRGSVIPGGKWAGPLFVVGPQIGSGFSGASGGSVVSFHPPLAKRLHKLRRMGASEPEAHHAPQRSRVQLRDDVKVHPLVRVFIGPIVAVLMALVAVLSAVALLLMGVLALGACAILMAVVYALFVLIAPT